MARPPLRAVPDLTRAALRTWRPRGLARRLGYEASRRAGRCDVAEQRWLRELDRASLRLDVLELTPPPGDPTRLVEAEPAGLTIYGGLRLDVGLPPDWHTHPVTGHRFASEVHWSTLSDADAATGDIKDVWELGRLSWLLPIVRRWTTGEDAAAAETAWATIDDWRAANPAYRGVGWMCAQETSLRAITAMFVASALRDSPSATDERHHGVAVLAAESVGRVLPTLRYALSQRNNHAISEAGFLWTATLLVANLPDAVSIRRRAARALSEAVRDQFLPDGSYAQHSPTYQRLALQVLLWCAAVSKQTGTALPDGVAVAIDRGSLALERFIVPGSEGQAPNRGGNDGAHLFALTDLPIGDLRPIVVHARAAVSAPTTIPAGPWDEEALWFGLCPSRSTTPPAQPPNNIEHPLVAGDTYASLRAGTVRHRPAHADQLHVDIWVRGRPVAVDGGSYRYTAPAPWGNALADEDVHNVPRLAGKPQAERRGRFFWMRWSCAEVEAHAVSQWGSAVVARMQLPGGAVVRRLAIVRTEGAVVIDEASQPDLTVRWNLAPGANVRLETGEAVIHHADWAGVLRFGGSAGVRQGTDDDPRSGWESLVYGTRRPLVAVEVNSGSQNRAVAAFAASAALLEGLVAMANDLDPVALDAGRLGSLLSRQP